MAIDKRYEFHLASGSGHHHSSRCWRSWISKVSDVFSDPHQTSCISISGHLNLIQLFLFVFFLNSFHLVQSALTSCLASFSPWSSLSSTSLIGERTCFSRTRMTEEDAREKRSNLLLCYYTIRPFLLKTRGLTIGAGPKKKINFLLHMNFPSSTLL